MTTTMTERVRWVTGVALVAMLLAYGEPTVISARAVLSEVMADGYGVSVEAAGRGLLPECQSACGIEAACAQECEYGTEWGWVFTTCGAYEGGHLGNPQQCDPASWDTCNFICSPNYSNGSEECQLDGELATCEDAGIYLYCGDGHCAWDSGEDTGTCSVDCGSPPDIDLPGAYDLHDVVDDADQSGYFDGTPAGMSAVLYAMAAAGFLPIGNYDLDFLDEDWNPVFDFFSGELSCAEKDERLAKHSSLGWKLWIAGGALWVAGAVTLTAAPPVAAALLSAAGHVHAAAGLVMASQDMVQAMPCVQ